MNVITEFVFQSWRPPSNCVLNNLHFCRSSLPRITRLDVLPPFSTLSCLIYLIYLPTLSQRSDILPRELHFWTMIFYNFSFFYALYVLRTVEFIDSVWKVAFFNEFLVLWGFIPYLSFPSIILVLPAPFCLSHIC